MADTVGHSTPHGVRKLVQFTKDLVAATGQPVKIDWHGHRDRGFGLANALAAIEEGVDRVHGTALGIGYCLIGLYSLTGSFEQPDAVVRDRAFWFGITALVVGVVAVAVSWLEQRLDLVWCADPRRRARLAPRATRKR